MFTIGVATLLVLSAAAELFGTLTVALTYARGHRLAERLLGEIATEDATDRTRSNVENAVEEMNAGHAALYRGEQTEQRLRSLRKQVSDQLRARPILTAGLVAYGLGAVLGLAAGLVALYR